MPESIKEFYPGNYSKGEIKSVGKLQVIYNLSKCNYPHIALSAYSKNDQSCSGDILSVLKAGDLVIRDLGYFATDTFKAITDLGADYITRLKGNCSLFDIKTRKPLCLLKLLKGSMVIRRKILLGSEKKLPVYLIAMKVPPDIASQRRRALKKNRDARIKITKEKLQLCAWDIYLCSSDKIKVDQVKSLYKIRWQIEIIFKAWKSALKMEDNVYLYCKYRYLPEAVIWLTLLFFLLTVVPIYIILSSTQDTSIIKLTQLVLKTIKASLSWKMSKIDDFFKYYSTHETRARVPLVRKIKELT